MPTYNLKISFGAYAINSMGWNLTTAIRSGKRKLLALDLPEPQAEAICKLVRKLYDAKRLALPGWMSLTFTDDTTLDDRITVRLER